MSTEKLVYGVLAGLAIGAITGILFAPQKGSVIRNKIMGKGDYYLHKQKFERTKKDAENLVAKGKAEYDEAVNDAKKAASDIKQSVS
ncbi:MAG: YtxH domain-containing protein [Salinivirgaceae bacterium]